MWSRAVSELARGFVQLLYPGRCLVCDAPEPESPPFRHNICSDCIASMAVDPLAACPHCAANIGPHTDTDYGCPTCRKAGYHFDAALRLGPYDGRLRTAVLRMKGAAGDALAEAMGAVYAEARGEAVRAADIEAVVPIPLHRWRRFRRGHNQAEGLGRELAAACGLAFEAGWLRRTRMGTQHAQPSAAARKANVKGSFTVRSRASTAGRSVLLVDDVMTTGSTLSEAAGALKAAGAARVVAAVLARR